MLISHSSEKNASKQTPLVKLPDLEQSPEQTNTIATEILDQFGDQRSERFYQMVAAKVPYDVIRRALSEIRADGANEPPKVFTYRMNEYAMERLKNNIGNGGSNGD